MKLQLFLETLLKGAQTAHAFLEKTYTEKYVTITKHPLVFFPRSYDIPRTYYRSRSQSVQLNAQLLKIHLKQAAPVLPK